MMEDRTGKMLRPKLPMLVRAVMVVLCFMACDAVFAQAPQYADSATINWAEMYRYFDQPVDPDIYLIRPGEELIVTFVGAKVSPLTLSVDPEGKIVDQTLGVFDLSNETLSGARTMLQDALRRLYNVDQITVSVSEPRRVAVSVSGAVEEPGLYKGFTSQRVSELIEQAGGVLRHGSTRWIIFSGGPEDIIVDLDKVAYLGDNSSNPCLYAGYSIHVPDKSEKRIQVVGEVNRPREIELTPGDDLDLILTLAGGVRSAADIDSVRTIGRSGRVGGRDLIPQPGEIVYIPTRKSSQTRDRLIVFGAVNSPGQYDYKAQMTLEDLIEQDAGGFVPGASRGLITVFRKASADEWGRTSDRRYPITAAVGGHNEILSLALQPADSVYIPFSVGYVRVSGEVLNPGLFPFVENKDALHYVNTAGGFLPRANKTRIDIYNRIAKVTATFSPGVLIHDGDELIVNIREELK